MKSLSRKLLGLFAFSLITISVLVFQSCAAKETKSVKDLEQKESPSKKISFEMPETCRGCHPQLFSQWQASLHSISFVDPLYWAEANLAGEEAGEEVRNFCHSCHAAAATMIEEIPKDATKASPLAKSGVPCDFCHTVTKVKKIGNKNVEVETQSGVKRGPYKDSYSPYHLTEYSEIHTKAEFCAACHNVYHPANGLPIENPYDEWKNGPYSKEGIVCQDCHMTPGPQVTKPNPGRVGIGGPVREHYYTHSTIGGNVFITSYMGNTTGYNIALERLKSAAKLEIRELKAEQERISFVVRIHNVGAGHNLPTGLTVMRQMWLHVLVRDASGKVLFENGKLDSEGNVPKDARLFNTVYADKNGKPTEKVWEAAKILKDKRIPPKGYLDEKFEIPTNGSFKKPFKIKVELLYRSAPQHIVNKLMKDKPVVPVVQMTYAEANL